MYCPREIFHKADFVAIKINSKNVYCVVKDRLNIFEPDDVISADTYHSIISKYNCPVVIQKDNLM